MSEDLFTDIIQHKKVAETLFCATVLVNAEGPRRRCGWLKPDDFSDERLGQYWQKVLDGIEPSQAAIATTVYNDLLKAQTAFVSSLEFESFAQSISDDAYLLSMAKRLPALATALGDRDMHALRKISTEIYTASPASNDVMPDAIDIAGRFIAGLSRPPTAIKTGIIDIDRTMGGMDRKALHLLAGRPGMGKSALALNIAYNVAVAGKRVALFSLEMAEEQEFGRLVYGRAGVDNRKKRYGTLTDDEIERLTTVSTEIMEEVEDRLMICDLSRMSSEDIWRKCADVRPDVILVDHLSKVADKGDNEVLRLDRISWMGKIMAKELDAVSIYCMQLNRGVEARENKRPMLSDLRGSGSLEENADNVYFIYRDDYYDRQNTKEIGEAEFIIAKFRDGSAGAPIKLLFDTKKQRFFCEARLP